MISVDSQALQTVNRALGVVGMGAQLTEFMDGELVQTFDVTAPVRRGNTLAITEGIFIGIMQNTHAGADSQTSDIDPYAVTVANAHAPYQPIITPDFDIWLIRAGVNQVSGTGTLSALLDINLAVQGFGVDQAGADVTSQPTMPIALWTSVITEGAIEMGLLEGSGVPSQSLNFRIPRTNTPQLTFRTTSSAAAVFQLNLVMGVFPVSLGQDAAF